MTGLKGVTWNQNHLNILFHLQQGLPVNEVAEKTGLSITLCKKILKLKDAKQTPGIVTDAMISAAPKPVAFGEYDLNKDHPPKQETGEQAPAPMPDKKPPVFQKHPPAVLHTTALELANSTQTIPMTQDISVSYYIALRGGYEADLSEWISYCCRDFWLGRGRNLYEEYAQAMMEQSKETQALMEQEEVAVG